MTLILVVDGGVRPTTLLKPLKKLVSFYSLATASLPVVTFIFSANHFQHVLFHDIVVNLL